MANIKNNIAYIIIIIIIIIIKITKRLQCKVMLLQIENAVGAARGSGHYTSLQL